MRLKKEQITQILIVLTCICGIVLVFIMKEYIERKIDSNLSKTPETHYVCAGVIKDSYKMMQAIGGAPSIEKFEQPTIKSSSSMLLEQESLYEQRSHIIDNGFMMVDESMFSSAQLNIRESPNTDSECVGMFNINDTVNIVGRNEGTPWVRVKFGDNYGFVHGDYLSTEKTTRVYMGRFYTTGYCACTICCPGYGDGIGASGKKCEAGRTVAMYGVPFGTKVDIGGHIYTVEDRGPDYGQFDIYYNTHEEAKQHKIGYEDVYLILE